MSDYFTPLRSLELHEAPLPVEQVMRSGDRRRRTRQAGGLVATTAAVAALVVGGLQIAGDPRENSTPPAGPSSGFIPEDFALGADLPISSQQADVRGAAESPGDLLMPAACGTGYSLTGTPVDRLAIQGTNQQYTGLRDLAVFETAGQARSAIADQVARFEACPVEGRSPRTVTKVSPVDIGDGAWRVERDTVLDGFVSGVEVWYLVHRGTAALVVTDYLDRPEELERRGAEVRELGADVVEPLVEDLCSVRTVC